MKIVDTMPDSVRSVVLRVDYNFPLGADGTVADATRVDCTRETINFLLGAKKRVRLLTHWGRPGGQPNKGLSSELLVPHIENVLGRQVAFDPQALSGAYQEPEADFVLCENVRFYEGEESNDPAFVEALAQRGDVFVNDAFPVSHRVHASVVGLKNFLPSYVGYGCCKEWKNVQAVRDNLAHTCVIAGGGKVRTKLPLLCKLLPKVPQVLLGSLLARALQDFLQKKHSDEESQGWAKIVSEHIDKIVMPVDVLTFDGARPWGECPIDDVKDIGPRTLEVYTQEISKAQCVFMNGPVGQYEFSVGSQGTRGIADAIAWRASKCKNFHALFGGGDTVAAVMRHLDFSQQGLWEGELAFSPSGGALLHAMTYGALPGLEGLCI